MGKDLQGDTLGLLRVIEGPQRKINKYPGVFRVEGKKGPTFGIDYIHPQTGQRVRKILKGVTLESKAAEIRSIELADAARGALQKAYGIKAKPQTVPFEAMSDLYVAWAKQNKKSWDTDEYRLRSLKASFKGKLMSDINPYLVEKYKTGRVEDVARATVNKEISLGSQVFEKAGEWGKYEGENPFRKDSRFKVKRGKKPGALTVDQVKAIREQIKHPVKRDMVDFNFYTGWRIGEIRKLKWEDVNLETGKAWILDPKNTLSVEMELSGKAVALMARQKKRGAYVFCKLNGKPFKTSLHAAIKNAAARAGVILPPRKAWHILRRTWASMMLQTGCDVETLRVLGNWKDYQMPLWYAEAAGTERRKAALDQIPDLKTDGGNLPEKEKGLDPSG
jgi:integrase